MTFLRLQAYPSLSYTYRSLLFRLLNERLIDAARLGLFLLQAHHLMARGFTPSRHVFFDALIIGDDFQHLSQCQFFDFLGRKNNRHWTKVPQSVEFDIGLHHRNTLASVDGSNEQIDAALFGFRQIGGHAGELIDAVDQRILGDTHEAHRGRAGDGPHVQPHRSGTRGDNKGRHHAIEIAAQPYDRDSLRLEFLQLYQRRCRLYLRGKHDLTYGTFKLRVLDTIVCDPSGCQGTG